MRTWNHRVVRKVHSDHNDSYKVHEVYYYPGDTVHDFNDRAEGPYGDTLEELKRVLTCMLCALDKPVLDWEDLPSND